MYRYLLITCTSPACRGIKLRKLRHARNVRIKRCMAGTISFVEKYIYIYRFEKQWQSLWPNHAVVAQSQLLGPIRQARNIPTLPERPEKLRLSLLHRHFRIEALATTERLSVGMTRYWMYVYTCNYVPRRNINTFKRSIYDLGILEKKKEFRESNPKTFYFFFIFFILVSCY